LATPLTYSPYCASIDSLGELDTTLAQIPYSEYSLTFSKLKPSLRTISLRLPEMMIEELKLLANKMDVPYQTLIKIYLSERIQKELKSARA